MFGEGRGGVRRYWAKPFADRPKGELQRLRRYFDGVVI